MMINYSNLDLKTRSSREKFTGSLPNYSEFIRHLRSLLSVKATSIALKSFKAITLYFPVGFPFKRYFILNSVLPIGNIISNCKMYFLI